MSMDLRECYQVLDLPVGASLEEVRLAYQFLEIVYHPDQFEKDRDLQDKAQDKLKPISLAYEQLRRHLSAESHEPFAE